MPQAEFRRRTVTAEDVQRRNQEMARKSEERQRRVDEKAQKESAIRASWERIKDEDAVIDLLRQFKVQVAMLMRSAIDASFGEQLYDSTQRVSILDKISGLEQAISYLERRLQGQDPMPYNVDNGTEQEPEINS